MKTGLTSMDNNFARGGPKLEETFPSRSRFFKTADTFRTDIQRTDYAKKNPGGEMSKTTGDKSKTPIKPKT